MLGCEHASVPGQGVKAACVWLFLSPDLFLHLNCEDTQQPNWVPACSKKDGTSSSLLFLCKH